MKVKIDYEKCCWKDGKCDCGCESSETGSCNGCAEVCPVKAIQRKDKVIIDDKKCTGCGACVEACPKSALSLS